MTALFPNAGVAPNKTQNTVTPTVTSTEDCPPLFHPMRCTPRFDPAAANAVISELLNAINVVKPYDCTRLDNLAQALRNLFNLCSLPVNTTPDDDDGLAGCFDGTAGLVTIATLRALFSICALPTRNDPDLDDTIGMCVDGVQSQVPVASVLALAGGGPAPSFVMAVNGVYNVGVTVPLYTARRDVGFGGTIPGSQLRLWQLADDGSNMVARPPAQQGTWKLVTDQASNLGNGGAVTMWERIA